MRRKMIMRLSAAVLAWCALISCCDALSLEKNRGVMGTLSLGPWGPEKRGSVIMLSPCRMHSMRGGGGGSSITSTLPLPEHGAGTLIGAGTWISTLHAGKAGF